MMVEINHAVRLFGRQFQAVWLSSSKAWSLTIVYFLVCNTTASHNAYMINDFLFNQQFISRTCINYSSIYQLEPYPKHTKNINWQAIISQSTSGLACLFITFAP